VEGGHISADRTAGEGSVELVDGLPAMRNERSPATGCRRDSSCGLTRTRPAAISVGGLARSRYSDSISRKSSPYVKKRQRRLSGVDQMVVSLAARG
jgi:hypothetical protein